MLSDFFENIGQKNEINHFFFKSLYVIVYTRFSAYFLWKKDSKRLYQGCGKFMNILFQGDSITDAGRSRVIDSNLGNGYVGEISRRLRREGLNHNIKNRGIGGNRSIDIYARWIEDTLSIDYDILSILCGVNDVGYHLRAGIGVDNEKYEYIYDRMIYEALKKNPNAKIVLMTPFVFKVDLKDSNLSFSNDLFDDFDVWDKEVKEKAEIVRKLSAKYNTELVDLNKRFNEITENFDQYSFDGIHPTIKGHKIIADEWLAVMKEFLNV